MRHRETGARDEVERPLDLSPETAERRGRPAYAIVDIGSNSVRLVVYDGIGRAPLPRFGEKSFCRLAEGLDETGLLSAEGMERTLRALRRFRAIAEAMGVARIDVLATEATRRAANGPDLVAAIEAETGLRARILSGEEEATLAATGVISGFFRPIGLVGDMGGGSLEIAQALDDRVGDERISLPLGALPVASLMAAHGRRARGEVDRILAERLPAAMSSDTFYAVGGGWRALAKMFILATQAPLPVVHGLETRAGAMRDFASDLAKMAPDALAALPGLPSRRADTIAGSALVMDRVLKALGSERVVFSALGVREGWLYSLLPVEEQYLDPLVEGAQALGVPQARVGAFPQALARWTSRLFPDETPAETRLRVAACALSDIAWRDDEALRAVESFRRVTQFPFIGCDHAERVFLGAALHARYAGRVDDPAIQGTLRLLSPQALRRARTLGLAFLVAYRFSGSVPDILAGSRLDLSGKAVRLVVDSAARAPDSEALLSRLRLLAREVRARDVAVVEAAG
jgi:exopolyphosphatase/guanosine-5'-triphosphate,3'-diphosphate pyrophosphatase